MLLRDQSREIRLSAAGLKNLPGNARTLWMLVGDCLFPFVLRLFHCFERRDRPGIDCRLGRLWGVFW
jgi:hypothetical protein